MFEKIKDAIHQAMTDANGVQEMSSYSCVLTTIGIHVLLGYHEHLGQHATLMEYALAMAANASGHGAAYLMRK